MNRLKSGSLFSNLCCGSLSSSQTETEMAVRDLAVDELQKLGEDFYNSLWKRRIGSGGFSTVYCYKKKYAIKDYQNKVASYRSKVLNRMQAIGQRIRHPHIVSLYGCVEYSGHFYFIMDYVEGKIVNDKLVRLHFSVRNYANSLFSQLTTNKPINQATKKELHRRWENSKRYLEQVRSAVAYLHKMGYIYRDVKGSNTLVAMNNGMVENVVIVDLDSVIHSTQRKNSVFGTIFAMSPQMAEGLDKRKMHASYSNKTDARNVILSQIKLEQMKNC